MSKFRLSLVLMLGFAAACSCGDDGGTVSGKPDLRAEPEVLSFEACPTKDGNGQTVADVFPAEQRFTLSNLGNVSATLTFTFEGPGASAFTIDSAQKPASIEASGDLVVPVRFAPETAGATSATLVVEDGNDSTEPLRIALSGTGSSLPAQPTLEVRTQLTTLTDFFTCFESGGTCSLDFDPTFYGNARTQEVRIKNKGCPAVRLTGMDVEKGFGAGDNLAFFLDEPSVLPTTQTPVLLTSNQETVLKVRFQPEEDSSGSDGRTGKLLITSNDPANPEYEVNLSGVGERPSIYSVPSLCNFTDSNDLCGLASKVPNKARFELNNAGLSPIQVTAALENGGQGRFAIDTPLSNATIASGGTAILEVTYTDAPTFVSERLVVTATAGGTPAGEAIIFLSGGTLPALATDPDNQLDFLNPAQAVSTLPVKIKNGAGAGTLIINRVFVEDPNGYFSVPSAPTSGTQVPAGSELTVNVQYSRPPSGGVQSAVLRVDTNDPDYGGPSYKGVLLYSQSPLDQLPIAAIQTRPAGTTTWYDSPRNQSLQAIPGTPKKMELTCDPSYDPVESGSPKKVKQCLFTLVTKPVNATSTSLDNDGTKIDAYVGGQPNIVTLTLTPAVLGKYEVDVRVYDDVGQPSASRAKIQIFTVQ